MIKAKNLTKIYKTKEKNDVIALNDVSFTLDNNGMVFICGKSGSGKSTLLNILAGLDDCSSGDVIIDGNSLKQLDINLFDNYRSKYIGFIFQDFHLIDNLTIKENIELSLNLLNLEDENIISLMLEKVGLSGYEDRFPKELSGGEKQRVAIARALVKNPKYILADEPTGNLDYNTSVQILNLLKELSKERLVLIISHDINNAYKYADRIIELAKGKIINDITRKSETEGKYVDGNVIYIPSNKLEIEEINHINNLLSTGKYTISQEDHRYKETIQPIDNGEVVSLDTNIKIENRNLYKLSKTFYRSNFWNTFITALTTSLLLLIIVITQIFCSFDGVTLVKEEVKNDHTFALYRGYRANDLVKTLKSTHLVPILDEDIDYIYDLGYEGNIYKLYSYNMSAVPSGAVGKNIHNLCRNIHVSYSDMSDLYVDSGKGVLECDLDYLIDIYGIDGKLDVIAGDLNQQDDCGIIITDYFADCIQYYYKLSYDDIINVEKVWMGLVGYNVKAIINTNYKTRYADVISKYEAIEQSKDYAEKVEMFEQMTDDDLFARYYKELCGSLGVSYYVDGDFAEALRTYTKYSNTMWSIIPKFFDENGILINRGDEWFEYEYRADINDGEIIIGDMLYRNLFQKDPSTFTEPFKITFTENYMYQSSNPEAAFSREFTVVGIDYTNSRNRFSLSYNDYYDLYNVSIFSYGLYFDNVESIVEIFSTDEDILFVSVDPYVKSLLEVNDIVLIFEDIFILLTVILYFLCALMLVNYGRRNIKRKIFEIGVIRALGAKNKDLFIVVLTQVLLMLLIVCVITMVPMIFVEDYINKIFVDGIIAFSNSDILQNFSIININPMIFVVNMTFITLITLSCSSILLSTLKKIKPLNIIRKDND